MLAYLSLLHLILFQLILSYLSLVFGQMVICAKSGEISSRRTNNNIVNKNIHNDSHETLCVSQFSPGGVSVGV